MRLKFSIAYAVALVLSVQKIMAQTSSPIIITEINYNSDSTTNSGNWVELYNKSAAMVDISGWKIKNALAVTYSMPSGTQLNASAYIVVYQNQAEFDALHPGIANKVGPSNVDFDNTADNVQLLDGSNNLMVNVAYVDSGVWPKGADGFGRTLELLNYNGNLNDGANWFDGCMFGSPGVAYTPCNPDIVFSELNYNSSIIKDAGDWIELHNTTSSAISISGYHLSDSKDSNTYLIPNITLPANGYRVLCNDVAKFNTRHPGVTNVNGPFPFGFKGKGEAARLYAPNGKLIFSMLYDNKLPWPVSADSGGYTLELLDIHGKMDDAANWFAGCPEGSPGIAYDPFCLNAVPEIYSADFNFYLTTVTQQTVTVNVSGLNKLNECVLSVIDLSGKEVFRSRIYNGTNEINTSALAAGLYFVQLTSGNEMHSLKFIKS